MLSAQVKVDLNSFNVPVALTVGVNDILATQEIVAKAEITAIEGLKLTVNGGYTIDADGRKLVGTVYEIADTKGDDIVGKWKAGLDAEYDMNIMKITAGISAEQKIKKGEDVKLGLNAAVETSSLIPGATLKLAWADAKDVLDADRSYRSKGSWKDHSIYQDDILSLLKIDNERPPEFIWRLFHS